eukprot:7984747-Alexandrium_andersonii.AAC.1
MRPAEGTLRKEVKIALGRVHASGVGRRSRCAERTARETAMQQRADLAALGRTRGFMGRNSRNT